MSEHTPGPWRLFDAHETIAVQDSGKGWVVKWTGFDDSARPLQEHRANARLISKAWLLPEMVEALRGVLAWGRRAHVFCEPEDARVEERIESALAKYEAD